MDARRVDGSSRKAPQTYECLTEGSVGGWKVDAWSHELTESRWNLTEGTADARKIDGSLWNVLRLQGKLTEVPADARKVDGRSHSHTESWLKLIGRPSFRTKCFPRTDKKLMEVDGRSREQMES